MNNTEKRIYIIGSGAIGLSLAAALTRAGRDVVLLRGRDGEGPRGLISVKIVAEDGSTSATPVPHALLDHFPSLDGIIVITAKSYGNKQLAERLHHKAGKSPVVILQNGLGVEQAFLQLNYPAVFRCVLFFTAQVTAPATVRIKPVAASPIGIIKGDAHQLESIVKTLHTPGFPFRNEADINTVTWRKAIINCVYNSVCPLLEADNGIFHRNEKALAIAKQVITECIQVAATQQVHLELNDVLDNLLHISRLSDGQLISTLQDIQQHRLTEIGTLNLEIARIAAAAGQAEAVPLTSMLGELTAIKSSLSL